jgi:hypothetical protein
LVNGIYGVGRVADETDMKVSNQDNGKEPKGNRAAS